MNVKLLEGQTIADIAIQATGDISRLFDIALLNDSGITDDLDEGEWITVPDAASDKEIVVTTFTDSSIYPASSIVKNTEAALEGIGYWTIGLDFKVS